MRVLVLGATTLIGNNLLRATLEAGWLPVVFDRPGRRGRRHPALEGLDVELAPGRPEDSDALRQAMAGCQVVFHAAGYAPPNALYHGRRLEVAREAIRHVLRAAREAHIGRLVYTSSVSTIHQSDSPGRLPDEWHTYRLGRVSHPFWDAKLVQEEAVLAFGRETGTPVVVVNPSTLLGPYDFALSAATPLLDVLRGKRSYVPGGISIADARDVAQGHLAAATEGRPGERYILAGHNVSRLEMLSVMARACKRPAPDHPVNLKTYIRMMRVSEHISCWGRPNRPFPAGFELATVLHANWYDSQKARDELGYRNRPLAATCRATLAWLKEIKVIH